MNENNTREELSIPTNSLVARSIDLAMTRHLGELLPRLQGGPVHFTKAELETVVRAVDVYRSVLFKTVKAALDQQDAPTQDEAPTQAAHVVETTKAFRPTVVVRGVTFEADADRVTELAEFAEHAATCDHCFELAKSGQSNFLRAVKFADNAA